jgi:hypothetical protein
MTGLPAAKCSITMPRMAGFSRCHSRSCALATVMKSPPKKTSLTPGTANSLVASGEASADCGSAK